MRDITITCNDKLVCDSRSESYGITAGTLKVGIDDTIPQLEMTISPAQGGYDVVTLGGDVKVWFTDTPDNPLFEATRELVFRGRLDEVDVDSLGNKTVVANGDISRLKDVYIDTWDYDYYTTLTGGYMPDEIFTKYNKWCSSTLSGSVPFEFSLGTGVTSADVEFCPSSGATAFDALCTIREAFADRSLHFYCPPTEDKTRTVKFVVGARVDADYSGPLYTMTYVMDINPQVLEYGRNITSITTEKQIPDATVYYHNATDCNGDHVDISNLYGDPVLLFEWNGVAQDAVSTYPKASDTETATYGFIYKELSVGQVAATGKTAQSKVYEIIVKSMGYDREHPTITVDGVDMHFVDESVEEFSPYKLVHVVSPLHGVDNYLTINSITYNLLDATDTKISVGSEQALITR